MIVTNILLGATMLFLIINFLVATSSTERIIILYGSIMTILATVFSSFNLEQSVLIDLTLVLILTKITLLIIIIKFRK